MRSVHGVSHSPKAGEDQCPAQAVRKRESEFPLPPLSCSIQVLNRWEENHLGKASPLLTFPAQMPIWSKNILPGTRSSICVKYLCTYDWVKLCIYTQSLNHAQLFVTPWTVASQVPLFMGFLRQEYWSGLPAPSPGDLPNPRIKLVSALAGGFFITVPHRINHRSKCNPHQQPYKMCTIISVPFYRLQTEESARGSHWA